VSTWAADFSFGLESERMAAVQPTIHQRIPALDFLRGLAILGILLANIVAFGSPELGHQMAMEDVPSAPPDSVVDALRTAFVTGKFRSMLAMLFGVGIYLQYRKRAQVSGNWPGGYLKRTAFLALFGLIHGIFIWYGDILFLYSMIALVTCLLAGLATPVLKWIIGVLAGIAAMIAIALVAWGLLWTPPRVGLEEAGVAQVGQPGTQAEPTIAEAKTPPEEAADPGDAIVRALMGPLADPEEEQRIYATGSYREQLAARAQIFAFMSMNMVCFAPLMLPLFLLGILFGRSGVLAHPSQVKSTRNAALLVGFGVGLPINLSALLFLQEGPPMWLTFTVEEFGGPLLAIGYIMLGAMIAEGGRMGGLQRGIANVGRVAFSVYIMQSLLATFIFYSWGLGLFGQLDRVYQLGVVAIIWVLNIAFANAWLRVYQVGPLEWLWRSLTEGRKLPMKGYPVVSREESLAPPRYQI
jgi:uncharacterized protein